MSPSAFGCWAKTWCCSEPGSAKSGSWKNIAATAAHLSNMACRQNVTSNAVTTAGTLRRTGTILETPKDPDGKIKDRLCHPAYPTHEYAGIIFAWMGPADTVPAFPILDSYDQPDTDTIPFSLDFPCNWLQVLENCQDPTHSCFLHTCVSGVAVCRKLG